MRRNIREVMDETKLDESTLAAQRQEAERLQRVQEQQRLLRELQRQAAQERMQHKVISLLQGNNYPKPGSLKKNCSFPYHLFNILYRYIKYANRQYSISEIAKWSNETDDTIAEKAV